MAACCGSIALASARALPVLMYHHVSPAPGLVTVSPQTFRAQMQWLAQHGWRSAGSADLTRFLTGAALPERSVLITFDDGYLDNWVHAAPVLAEFGLRAMLFMITGRIGDGPVRPQSGPAAPPCPDHRTCVERVEAGQPDSVMLRWSEVDTMAGQNVFEFHSHTHTHQRWDRSEADPVRRHQLLAEDLSASRAALERRLGSASDHLCWPQGYHDAGYRKTACDAGYRHLYTVEKGTLTRTSDPLLIPRIVIKDKAGGWFARRMGVYRRPWLAAAYGRLRGV